MAIWHQILRKNFTHWEALADFLELPEEARRLILDRGYEELDAKLLELGAKLERVKAVKPSQEPLLV